MRQGSESFFVQVQRRVWSLSLSVLLLLVSTMAVAQSAPEGDAEAKAAAEDAPVEEKVSADEVGYALMRASEGAAAVGALQCDAPHTVVKRPNLRILMISAENEVVPGEPLHLALRFDLDPKWHIYYGENSGGIGLRTSVEWLMPDGFLNEEVIWPAPITYQEPTGDTSFVYEDELVIFTKTEAPAELRIGEELHFGVKIGYQLCSDKCIRGDADVEIILPVVEQPSPVIGEPWCKTFEDAFNAVPKDQREGFSLEAEMAHSTLRPGDESLVVVAIDAEAGKTLKQSPRENHPTLVFDADERLEFETLALEPYGERGFRVISRVSVPEDIREFADWTTGAGFIEGLVRAEMSEKAPLEGALRFRIPLNFADEGAEVSQQGEGPLWEGIELRAEVEQSDKAAESSSEVPNSEDFPLWWALIFAFIGGLILNVMPCVLPVLSLKALTLVEEAGESKHNVKTFVGAYVLGVLASFWALAAVMIALQKSGELVGWGFQFQEPAFVVVMIAVIFAFSLSLFGVFEIPGLTVSGNATGLRGSFVHGVLTTALSTPCSAPFLGSALTFALMQPPAIIVLILSVVGLGLATPIAIITLIPAARRFIPKPGMWMEKFKQFIGFLMVGTVIYLMGILNAQLLPDAMETVYILLGLVAAAVWLLGLYPGPLAPKLKKNLARLGAITLLVGGGYFLSLEQGDATAQANLSSDHIEWQVFKGQESIDLASEGHTLLIDFTAEWCPTCKANEAASIERENVGKLIRENNVLAFKADLTRKNPMYSEWVQKFGRVAIPLVVVIPAGQPDNPIVMKEVFTEGALLDALSEAGPSTAK